MDTSLKRLCELYGEVDKARRTKAAHQALEVICGPSKTHYSKRPITYAELSSILGLYVQESGTGSNNQITSWANTKPPSHPSLWLLSKVADGSIIVELTGERMGPQGPQRREGTATPSIALIEELFESLVGEELFVGAEEVLCIWLEAKGYTLRATTNSITLLGRDGKPMKYKVHKGAGNVEKWYMLPDPYGSTLTFHSRAEAISGIGISVMAYEKGVQKKV